MTLPDWTSQLNAQIDAFLGWAPAVALTIIVAGAAVAFAVFRMFLKVFH